VASSSRLPIQRFGNRREGGELLLYRAREFGGRSRTDDLSRSRDCGRDGRIGDNGSHIAGDSLPQIDWHPDRRE
jgi:hypothetical protein